MGSSSRKKQDLEFEKVRLISLALDFGFDESSANKSLQRLISLYGTYAIRTSPIRFPFKSNAIQISAMQRY